VIDQMTSEQPLPNFLRINDMKLYTRTGDDGTTGLNGGQRVAKDGLRVTAYGTVDELNSFVGLARAGCSDEQLGSILSTLQARLFELGADLATPDQATNENASTNEGSVARISDAAILEAENQIDQLCQPLEPMKHFILPGGSELSGHLHVARAVCRRAERDCLALSRQEIIQREVLVYLNRLSDLLFAAARRANQLQGLPDTPWKP
jgi:cob(I)alamin adenosyltransferase